MFSFVFCAVDWNIEWRTTYIDQDRLKADLRNVAVGNQREMANMESELCSFETELESTKKKSFISI